MKRDILMAQPIYS